MQNAAAEETELWPGLEGDDLKHWLAKENYLETINADPFTAQLYADVRDDFTVEILDKLPDEYNLGETGGKGMIRLTPHVGAGKPIDIVYVRSMGDAVNTTVLDRDSHEKYTFISEAEFEVRDTDSSGAPLPKVLLYRALTHDFYEDIGFLY